MILKKNTRFSKTRDFQKHAIFKNTRFSKTHDFQKHVIFKNTRFHIKNAGDRKFYRFRMSQICLCGKSVGGTFTKEGLCFHCSFCHYFCTEQDAFIYDEGVKKFLATKQDRPRCCMIEGLMRNYARMRVVTDMEDDYFGRPFFVCSKKHNPCKYFAWGDQAIMETEDEREIGKDTTAEFLRLNDEFPYYPDEMLKLLHDALARNEEFDIHQEYMKVVSTKESLEKRLGQ